MDETVAFGKDEERKDVHGEYPATYVVSPCQQRKGQILLAGNVCVFMEPYDESAHISVLLGGTNTDGFIDLGRL